MLLLELTGMLYACSPNSRLNRQSLHHVVGLGRCAVRVDVLNVFGIHMRIFERPFHRAPRTITRWVKGGDVEGVG